MAAVGSRRILGGKADDPSCRPHCNLLGCVLVGMIDRIPKVPHSFLRRAPVAVK